MDTVDVLSLLAKQVKNGLTADPTIRASTRPKTSGARLSIMAAVPSLVGARGEKTRSNLFVPIDPETERSELKFHLMPNGFSTC